MDVSESFDIDRAVALLRRAYRTWRTPAVTIVAESGRDPFRVLVSCIISLRTRDEVTAVVSARVFEQADTPAKMLALSVEEIAALIYPAGFYRTKAGQLHEIARQLLELHGGRVPDEIDDLLVFPGVGRKTANLVITLGYGKQGICVDTHVHRITNRWGYVAARTPEGTEMALRAVLPGRYWIEINDLLVAFGQNVCHPVSPRCSSCPVQAMCPRLGVIRSR